MYKPGGNPFRLISCIACGPADTFKASCPATFVVVINASSGFGSLKVDRPVAGTGKMERGKGIWIKIETAPPYSLIQRQEK